MRVIKEGIALPGIETVEIEGLGAYNFANGEADFPDGVAAALCKKGICRPLSATQVQVPMGAKLGVAAADPTKLDT